MTRVTHSSVYAVPADFAFEFDALVDVGPVKLAIAFFDHRFRSLVEGSYAKR